MPENHMTQLSIVIPIYNEEQILPELHRRLSATFSKLPYRPEFVFIDDGSRDSSLPILLSLHARDARVKIISLSRNFGHQLAISAGIAHASGDAVIIMDGDLQDPPEILPQFIEKWKEGYDVVYAIRKQRKENLLKRTAYVVFYRTLKAVSYLNIPLDSGDFCIMDRRVADVLRQLPERNRFVRGLRTWAGFRQTGLAYSRDRRYAGKPKYTLGKLMKLAYDGIFSFTTVPLRMAIYTGIAAAALSFAGGVVVLYQKITNQVPIAGWSSTMVTLVFLGGLILLTLGIIGEYIGRIHEETKQRPLYVIQEKIGFADTVRPQKARRTGARRHNGSPRS
jgi:dolichol-phosphate mannosyltransferase